MGLEYKQSKRKQKTHCQHFTGCGSLAIGAELKKNGVRDNEGTSRQDSRAPNSEGWHILVALKDDMYLCPELMSIAVSGDHHTPQSHQSG